MYLTHFGLREKPFELNPDPRFFWMGEAHKEALATLEYGLQENRGFLLLMGDVGTGKTTLINRFLAGLDDRTCYALLSDPGLEALDFFNFLSHAFKLEKKFLSKGDFLVHFIHFLYKCHADNRKVVLIIDEAQRIPQEILEEIRLLSNIERKDSKLLNIFLVGQNELNETLMAVRHRALLQRITTHFTIGALKKNEVDSYIRFRLKVAGVDRKVFDAGAVQAVIAFSKCTPRLINVICDHALLTAYVKGQPKVNAKIVRECARELRLRPSNALRRWAVVRFMKKLIQRFGALLSGSLFWKLVPIYAVALALLALVAGYFVFPQRYDSTLALFRPESNRISVPAPAAGDAEGSPDRRTVPDVKPPPASPAVEESNTLEPIAERIDHHPRNAPPPASEPVETTAPATIEAPPPFPQKPFSIRFPTDSNALDDQIYAQLSRVVAVLKHYPDSRLIIRGYTDDVGSAAYNKRLSKFRADVVKSYFVGQGIDAEAIDTYGMGPENPVASNATVEGRKANRRVEIELQRS